MHSRNDYNGHAKGVNMTNSNVTKPNFVFEPGAVRMGLHHKKFFVEFSEYKFSYSIHTFKDNNEEILIIFEDELPMSTSTHQFKQKEYS